MTSFKLILLQSTIFVLLMLYAGRMKQAHCNVESKFYAKVRFVNTTTCNKWASREINCSEISDSFFSNSFAQFRRLFYVLSGFITSAHTANRYVKLIGQSDAMDAQ